MNLKHVLSVDNMRESDSRTIAGSVTSAELMHRAAQGIFNAVAFTGRVAIVCGSGNNGGDGYALACILLEHGITPTIFRASEKFSKDGLYYYQTARSMGAEEDVISVPAPFAGYDIVVDCLLGTGFDGAPRGAVLDAIEKINACTGFVVSADINSGLNGDTGVAETAVNSDLTVSIGHYKTGLFLNDAPYCVARMRNSEIGIEPAEPEYKLIDWELLHMFEGYNSTVMTSEQFFAKTGLRPEACDIAQYILEMSQRLKRTVVVKTARSAVVADLKYVYFCAEYAD